MNEAGDALKAATAEFFGAIAGRWRDLGPPAPGMLRDLREALACPPGGRILDAGCGAGNVAVALAEAGYRVAGIDLAPATIAEAAALAGARGLGDEAARFSVGDMEGLDAPDAAFDAILCRSAFDFVPHPAQALAEFWRVLRPGGRLVPIVLGAYSPVKYPTWRRFRPGSTLPASGTTILPWEVAALLDHVGRRIVAQAPDFGPAASGIANRSTPEDAMRLADPILQQTIATTWQFVAVKPGG